MKSLSLFASLLLCTTVVAATGDVLDRHARTSELASQRLITSIAHAGDRLVAAGQRGHIVSSADGGQTWTQGDVPVSSDLTAAYFVDAKIGYAVGHDGVVLGTRDGGAHWSRLLDGIQANALLLAHMRKKSAAPEASEDDRLLLAEAERNSELGPDKPFLDVWFANADEGFVVGAYNLVFKTADGGKTWEPWFDRTDNPKLLNLYAIRGTSDGIYIVGEAGLVLRLGPDQHRFVALPSPYEGSYFGLLPTMNGVIVYGMRGHAFLISTGGTLWSPVDTGLAASLVAGDTSTDGRLVLVDQSGGVAVSADGGGSFTLVPVKPQLPIAAVSITPQGLTLAGPRGLRTVNLAPEGR